MSRRRAPVPELRGRRCLITGAASGIGRATALAAAGRGAVLLLTDVNEEGLAETVARVARAGGTVAWSGAADLADHDAVVALAEEVHGAHGSVDVVMNVAGISVWGPIERLEHRHWRRTVDVSLMGPIHVLEQFVPPMIAAGRGGHVVNVSSAAGLFGLPWHAAYSAAKFGLRGVSEVLRFDLRRHRIGVSLVCPGGVRTPIVQTTEIVGVDRTKPAAAALVRQFERHAKSPEQVAERILDGIERDRYLVYTSADIRVGHLAQRLFPPAYELAMRLLNDRFASVARRSQVDA
ncbi:SDR family oxidoreductase [Conexibacter arvalis]|uniref:NAD(P)-dependent dehydrogenase (Short-subunit alcohol dehydrogenase family) n=1 Tax=Conexibacter arvalis TaxID=912552 RepID=A0A840I9E0_9ACTN|nr:SDR family oxidoreductase [Conexibacter arvalis]MBB4661529.1 NAD(P)-dependent dehydrogenase (short-subunit alcohol dehydrogenase family) [Conexibacter arvalis]